MSRATMLNMQVSRIKFLNQLHSFHNNVDIVYEINSKEPIKMEGIKIPAFEEGKRQILAKVDRNIDMNAPDLFVNRTISVLLQAKKFKNLLGTDVILCKGYIPLAKFLDNRKVDYQILTSNNCLNKLMCVSRCLPAKRKDESSSLHSD